MSDVHDIITRSYNMSRIRSKDTKPEMIVWKFLFAKGFRYRINDKKLKGKPDIVLPKYKTVIFVNGCFWHGHENCKYFKLPSTRTEWWKAKIERNIQNDIKNQTQLTTAGYKVIVIWECEIKNNTDKLINIIQEIKNQMVDFKEKISIENIQGKSYRIKTVEPENNDEAIFTHYLQNKSNDLKEDALKYAKDLLIKKYPTENITLTVAEEALQYDLFNSFEIPFPSIDQPKFTFIDLFAGIGGFRLALQNLGGKCVFTSEWDKDAKRTYRANFGEVPFGDITKVETKSYIPKDFDVLCAGFPCQAFSIAGYRKGFSDTRGTLFFDIEQIVENRRPKVVFLENVKNLYSHDNGKTFKVILEILEKKLKYKVFYKVLNSMTHANVPQNRERIFIVAFDPIQVANYQLFQFPDETKLTKTIHDFIEHKKQDDKFYYPKTHKYYPELEKIILKKDTVYQWRRVYVRENKSNVCPTLTANMGAGGHNVPLIRDEYGIRKLTPKECFAFQGYPMENYILPEIATSKLYMQAGNSVTTSLIERISSEIIKVL